MDEGVAAFEDHMAGLRSRVYAATNERYNPTYWEISRSALGAVDSIKKLLSSYEGEPQEGLYKLWEFGVLHLSVEREILKPEYSQFFTDAELTEARQRLTDLDFTAF